MLSFKIIKKKVFFVFKINSVIVNYKKSKYPKIKRPSIISKNEFW